MPEVGERRKFGEQFGEWDGHGWKLVDAPSQGILSSLSSIASPAGLSGLKKYAGELLSGEGTARKEAGAYGMKELKGGLSALNPINQAKGAANLVLHPIDSVKGAGTQLYNAATGDPEALGGVLGAALAPKLDLAALKGINAGASAVATKPYVQHTIGAVGGALGAKAAGLSPFIGMGVGRAASGLLKGPAEDVASGTGWLLDKLGQGAPKGALSPAEVADLEKRGYPPNVIDKLNKPASAGFTAKPKSSGMEMRATQMQNAPPEFQQLHRVIPVGSPPAIDPEWAKLRTDIDVQAQAIRDALMKEMASRQPLPDTWKPFVRTEK